MLLFLVAVVFSASGNLFSQTFINTLELPDTTGIWINKQFVDTNFFRSGTRSAYTDSLHPYGLGVEMKFPEGIKNHNANLLLEGYVFSDTVAPNALYVVSIENNGEVAFWQGVPLSKLIMKKKKWFLFSDTVVIPADVTNTGRLKIYLWNAGRKSRVLVDDLSITFKPYPNPSFLKDIETPQNNNFRTVKTLLYKNGFFQIWQGQNAGFQITGNRGDTLLKNLSYFFNVRYREKNYRAVAAFSFRGKTIDKGTTTLKFEAKTKLEKIKLSIILI